MDKIAALPDRDRSDLFQETASQRAVHPAIIEKDFWVCWVLRKLFTCERLKGQLIFKGGTSLSKVYGLIERFSEDIDLILDWRLLGYSKDGRDPWEEQRSNTRQDTFNKAINAAAAEYIAKTLLPHLRALFAQVPAVTLDVPADEPMVVNIAYPKAFSLDAIRPQVKLEIGPLASWVPSKEAVIKPYAAEVFEHVFDDPACPVVATLAERTFWEKATILHQQAHRPKSKKMQEHYARHYYDMYQLAASPVKDGALGDLELLADVVKFKQRFYRSPWAKYEDAKPGTFRLLPTEEHRRELEADYRGMEPMFFGEVPAWDDIMGSLGALERAINDLASPGTRT